MKKSKTTFLKEKQLQKSAKKNFENQNAQNPIEKQLLAFKKTKQEINIKDLL